MPDSAVLSFTDPYEHQRAVRASEARLFVTGPGRYQAELTRVALHRLWMQRNHTLLPHVARQALKLDRSVILFLTQPPQAPVHHTGMELAAGEIMFDAIGSEHYHRAPAGSHWASMSLTPEDLAAAGRAIGGYDLVAPKANRLIRPPSQLMERLLSLHDTTTRLAATAPDAIAHPELARAIEQALVRVMVKCLTDGSERTTVRHPRVPVMQRLERLLEENPDNSLYLAEVCSAIGVPERTLRLHCMEHLGMGPHQYLWLRRMNLARRSLARSNALTTTVTSIANDHGFAELGRFAVAYRRLFGEAPSTTLRRPFERLRDVASNNPMPRLPILP